MPCTSVPPPLWRWSSRSAASLALIRSASSRNSSIILCASGPRSGPGRANRKSKVGEDIVDLDGVLCVIPDGCSPPWLSWMSTNPSRKPESGCLVVLCWALLGCISSREGWIRPAVVGVFGANGEDAMAPKLRYVSEIGVSSRSMREVRRLFEKVADY